MSSPIRRPLVVATTLLTILNACTVAGKAPTATGITAATKAPVVTLDEAGTKSFGELARYMNQLNLAVVNLGNKRPPLMPLSKAVFGVKQNADEEAPPQDVSADDDFLDDGLTDGFTEATESHTTAEDGTITGSIDEDGDGDADQTYTETKPVETTNPDGSKSVAMTYTTTDDGEKDIFEVKETVDASGKVTGGEMDWTDETMGKQHVTFKGDDILLEPVPGMYLSLKASGLNAKGHVRLGGRLVFDQRFASAKQAPGQGQPVAQPMKTQGVYYYFPSGRANKVGWTTDPYGWVAAGMWCTDNEVGEDTFGIDVKSGFERIGRDIRLFWCQLKNSAKPWANDWRKARESKLEIRSIDDPALSLEITAECGNGPQADSNLICTMPNGGELRVKMPAKGVPTLQGIVKPVEGGTPAQTPASTAPAATVQTAPVHGIIFATNGDRYDAPRVEAEILKGGTFPNGQTKARVPMVVAGAYAFGQIPVGATVRVTVYVTDTVFRQREIVVTANPDGDPSANRLEFGGPNAPAETALPSTP